MDNKLTKDIQDWINTPKESRDLVKGAEMLFKLNKNKFLFNNILKSPNRFSEKLDYELKKHLQIRLDGLTTQEVAAMDAKVIPAAAETLEKNQTISSSDEITKGAKAIGRRADHDVLPAEIQKLWDDNFENYKIIKQLFEELKSMENEMPCDRYEKLKILDEIDKKYRKNLEDYDNYKIGDEIKDKEENITKSDVKSVGAARKFISTNRKKLSLLIKNKDVKTDELRKKIQCCVETIAASGSEFSPETKAELSKLGIEFNA